MSLRGEIMVRYARLDDCLAGADLRAPLHAEEARQLDRIADTTRRHQWLAGRALARELLCESLDLTPNDDMQIISRTENGLGTRPLVVANGRRIDCGLSISHTSRGVLVALGAKIDCPLGVDLCDEVESFSPGFLRLWFTAREQSWIQGDRRRAAMVWAIKEAVFKAASEGAAWNPRDIEVFPANEAGSRTSFRCVYRGEATEPLSLALRVVDGHTAAIACLARDVAIRFSVPIGSSREVQLLSTSDDSLSRSCSGTQIHTELFVTSVAFSPRWIST